jgi:hypothetical protein
MPRAPTLFLAMLLGAAAGFGADATGPAGPEPEACPSNKVSLAVGAGTVPQVTWTPRCYMGWLTVYDTATGSAVWNVAGGGNHLPSGLRYGGPLPAEATVFLAPQPLQAGRAYRVIVSRLVCEDPVRGILCSLLEAAGATFTP